MATGNFSAAEWKQVVNAPQLIYHLLVGSEKAGFFTKRGEARALEDYLKSAKSQSPLVQQIIAGQKEADDKVDASPEQTKRTLAQVGALIESKTDVVEGDAIREFLMNAAQAVAEAEREEKGKGAQAVSAAEQTALAEIADALKASEADKRRRHEAAVASEAKKRTEEEAFKAKRQEEARKELEEVREKREAETRAKADAEAREKREGENRERMEEARRKREEDTKKAAVAKAATDAAAKKADEEKARLEAEAKAQTEAAALKADAREREAVAKPPAQAVAATVSAKAVPKAGERIYVVKKGDTLSGIAEEMYGNAGRWKEIFEANRDVIDKPNLIRPGWKLRIP